MASWAEKNRDMMKRDKASVQKLSREEISEIKSKSVSAGMITLGSQGIKMVIQLTTTVILARILSPEDYGVIAMAMAITAFAGLFQGLGLSAAAIQKIQLSNQQINTLFWINTGMGGVLTLIVALMAPLIAWFYQKPELVPVTIGLSWLFLINGVGAQHGALLQRELRFGKKAIAEVVGILCNLVVAIYMGVQGLGYWALVGGLLSGLVAQTVLYMVFSGFTPGKPAGSSDMRGMLVFGAQLTGFEIVNYFHRNLDHILIGRVWGADMLGVYSRAYQLLMFPVNSLRAPVVAVAFPVMSRLQNHPEDFREYYRKVILYLAWGSMPLATFLFVVSDKIVLFLLGEQWRAAEPIFAILALVCIIQPVASLRGLVLMSLGQGKRYMYWGMINAVLVSLGFVIGIFWGVKGVAISYVIVVYSILYPSLLYVFKDTPLAPSDFFASICRPAFISLLTGGTVYGLSGMIYSEYAYLDLLGDLTVFIMAYLTASWLVLPKESKQIYRRIVRKLR